MQRLLTATTGLLFGTCFSICAGTTSMKSHLWLVTWSSAGSFLTASLALKTTSTPLVLLYSTLLRRRGSTISKANAASTKSNGVNRSPPTGNCWWMTWYHCCLYLFCLVAVVLLSFSFQKTQEGHLAPKAKTLQKYAATFLHLVKAPGVMEYAALPCLLLYVTFANIFWRVVWFARSGLHNAWQS